MSEEIVLPDTGRLAAEGFCHCGRPASNPNGACDRCLADAFVAATRDAQAEAAAFARVCVDDSDEPPDLRTADDFGS